MKDFKDFINLDENAIVQAHFREGHRHMAAGQEAGAEAEGHEERGEHEMAHIQHTIAAAHHAAAAYHFRKSNNEDEAMNASTGAGFHGDRAEALNKKHGVSLY